LDIALENRELLNLNVDFTMSFRQIFSRINRITRSYIDDDADRIDAGDLDRARQLIDEAAEKWELPEPEAEAGAEAEAEAGADVTMTHERACMLLDVPQGAPIEEVTRAYRRIIVSVHPDHGSGREPEEQRRAELRTQELNRAYEFLKRRHAAR
jgi:DnaJ-domain-containing protein 1